MGTGSLSLLLALLNARLLAKSALCADSMPDMADSPTDPDLLNALTSAGWLLEQTVAHVLADMDCHPRLGWAFKDVDDPSKSRELDAYGYRQVLRLEAEKIVVAVHFLIECKQSSMPYVGVGQTLPEWQFKQPTQHKLPAEELRFNLSGREAYRLLPAWGALGFDEVAKRHGEKRFRASQLTRLERTKGGAWSANNSGIFTSLVFPLAKAIRAVQKDHVGIAGAGDRTARDRWVYFDLAFPAVVTSAELIVVDTSSRESVITRPGWMTARRHLETNSISGLFDFDVVCESAFGGYVADRIAFAEAIAAAVRSDPLKHTGENWEPPVVDE